MISDEKLEQHSGIDYKINGKTVKVGDLTDNQLELGLNFLKNKFKRTQKQNTQMVAIKHVLEHRCQEAQKKLVDECYKSSKGNIYSNTSRFAEKIVNTIMSWLVNTGTLKKNYLSK